MTSISSVAATTTTTSTTASAATEQMNNFLQILMTQLQHQNPLEPMDSNEFTSQLVNYSQLEQQINTNATLTDLATKLGQLTTLSSLSFLGSTTEIQGADAPVQSGEASWAYEFSSNVGQATLTVTNADGDVVYSGTGETDAGRHTLSLSLDDLNGVSEGDVLTLTLSATTANGDATTATVTSFATPTAVSTGSSTIYTAGDLSFSDDVILKIHDSAKN